MRKILTFLIAISLPLLLFGQSPGGVVPAAWYKADATTTLFSDAGVTNSTNNTTVYQWNDVQGNGFNLLQTTAGLRPTFSNTTTLANFNPTVTFQSKWMEFQPGAGVNIIDRVNGTLFTAGYINTLTGCGIFGFDSTMDYPGLHTSNNGLYNLLFYTGGPGYQGLSSNSFQNNSYFTAGSNWQNGAGANASYAAATVSLNGNRTDYSGSQIQNAIQDINARDIRVGGDTNWGSLNGQVNEMLIFENRLTADEMDRVESYLSIKYGTTYAQGTKDYKNSSSAIVWNASTNSTYNNNIAGIARDATGLNQKQSWSVNAGKQILIGTTGLANTNAANSTSLNVGQYLIWGDNGLAKTPTVPISGVAGVNYRFASVWKAQNTGAVGTVRVAWPSGYTNLRLVQSNDAVFDNTDTITDMSVNTQTVNGVTYNYADVTIADGQYFTFAAFVQAPGGVVNNLSYWYRADKDAANTGDGTNVTGWTDQISSVTSSQISTAPLPKYKIGSTNYFNFNPGINFTATQQMLGNISVQTLTSLNFDIFTLTKEGMIGGTRYFNVGINNTLFGGGNWDSPGLNYDGTIGRRNNGQGVVYGPTNPGPVNFDANIPSIMYHTFTDTSISKGLNGAANGTAATHGAVGAVTGGHIFGANNGFTPPGGDDAGFIGNLGEVIVYGAGSITATERRRVDSYLAIKYGITLARTATDNYLSSTASIVWDGAANSSYNNNIAGIAYDFASGLNQKQSISVNTGQKLIIGTTGLANTNAGNATSLTDGQFLIVGDNGLQQAPTVAISGISGVNYRFASVWKAQNTGAVGTVRVAWPSGYTNLRLVQSNDAVFDNTDTITDMSVNTQTVNGVTYNYADVTVANGQYFTFAVFVQAPGGVVGPDFWVKSDNAGTIATSWKDNSLNADDIPNVGGVSLSAADKNHNFYPYTTGYTASKFFYNSNSVMNPLGNVELPNTNTSIFSAVRPTTVNGTGRITGIDDDATYASEPAVSIANGKPRQYEYFNTTTSTDFSTAFNNGISNIFSAIANNSTANGGTSSSSGGEKILGLNGSYETTSFTGSNKFQIYGRNLRIGQAGWDAAGAFPGDIMEVVWYKRTLTPNEQSRVNSYLAVKNGVTLNENYLSTTSSIVWDRALNTGYNNNIFGIAKDDATALHQKQAGSVNAGQNLIISTTGLTDSNAANNTGITNDLQYLMTGDNGLKQGLLVPISGITGINYRFASIWKTQNSGNVGTVRVAWPTGLTSLRLIQSSDAVFDNTDTVTDMSANTQTVNGVTYNYADVTLANGQYFTFAAFAIAPGGVVNNLSYWYRADKNATNTGDGTDVTSWKDQFQGKISSQLGTNTLPKYKVGASNYLNYNPGINFTANTQTIGNISLRTLTSLNYDVFTLTKEGIASGGGNPRVFSIGMDNTTTGAANWDAFGIWPTGQIERRVYNGGTQFPTVAPPYDTTIPSIMYYTNTDTSTAKGLNGAAMSASSAYSAVGNQLGGHMFGNTVFSGNGSDNAGFLGNLGETIVYGDGSLTTTERRRVDSYLAIKYGITLGRVSTDHYLGGDASIVWNGGTSSAYNNNIFGVARDDIEAFAQKVSVSVNTGVILTVASNNDFVSQNLAATRTGFANDKTYFLLGDNTTTATPLVGFTVAGNPAQHIQRIWLSQRTNTPGTLYFQADLSSYGASFTAGNNVRMFVADDAAFTTNVQSVAGSYTGGKWVFNKSFDSDAAARYITFGTEVQPQVLWVKADKGVNTASGVPADNTQITTWYDQETANGSQDGTAPTVDPGEPAETAATLPALPFYKYNTTDNFNFNPVINFSNLNRGNAVQFTTPTFGSQTVISVFKAAGFGNSQATSMLLYGGDVSNPSAGDAAPARADMSFGVSAGSFLSFGGGSAGDYTYIGNLGLQTQPAIGVLKRNRVSDEEIYYSSYGSGSNDILNQNADPTNTLTGEGRLLTGLVRIGKHFSAPTTLNDPTGRLNGSYAELIVYDRVLSEAERAMVESYLAVKYGITLTGGTDQFGATAGNVSYPYVSSAGTVVRASDATYKYDVFGLGRDDYYGLNQRISKSNNAGDILTVSTNTDFTALNLDATRTAINGDQEYMLFGNNKGSGNAVVEQTTELPANVQRRLDREWKVAQANTDGTNISNISLKFNLTGVTLTGATATNVMLLVDTDGDGDFTTGTVQVIPASSYTAGSAATFNNVILTDGQVFTLGVAQGLCYKPGAVASAGNPALNGKAGITSLSRAGTTGDNWPGIRTGAWLVLESKTKGFVPNRVAFSGGNPVGIAPVNFVEGMLVYDTTNKCLKMYTSQDNGVTFGWYCLNTQTCPD